MQRKNRTQLALGLVLILLGAWFVAVRQIPALGEWVQVTFTWPLNIVAAGGLLLLIGLVVGAPGMAIPAAIVSGIGGILYYQELTESYSSWSFMWTLIPGFIGVGNILSALLGGGKGGYREGLNLIVVSAVLFLIFAAIFGQINILGAYGPGILLVLLGLYIVGRGLWRARKEG